MNDRRSHDLHAVQTPWTALPKVELHVHLEGSFDAGWLLQQARALGRPLPRPAGQLFTFDGLSDFLRLLDWLTGLFETPEDLHRAAYAAAGRYHTDGIVYSEVIINPTHWPHWALGDLVHAVSDGFEQAAAEGLTDCRLLLSLARRQTADEGHRLLDWLEQHRPSRVVGLSVDGNEAVAGRTSPRFAPVFARARELGYGLTAHAGESSGPEGVWDALDFLKVDRIDHGVRAAEDPRLVARLVEEQVTLNVCVTSNLRLVYRSLEEHPIGLLLAAGVPVTVNTDDPGLLGITLSDEFALVAAHLGWGAADAVAAVRRAIDAAFCSPEEKARLHRLVTRFTENNVVEEIPE